MGGRKKLVTLEREEGVISLKSNGGNSFSASAAAAAAAAAARAVQEGDRFQGFNPRRRRRKIESDMGTQSRKYEMPKVYLFYIEEKRNISREHFIFGKCGYGEKLTF